MHQRPWIVFDVSGVITDEDVRATSRELSQAYGIDEDTIYRSVFCTNYDLAYHGNFTNEQYYRNVIRDTHLPLTYDEFISAYLSHARVRPFMTDVIKILRQEKSGIAILSNQTSINTDYLHPILDPIVDISIYSSEVGLSKPDPAIYRMMQEKLPCPPECVIFFDDRETNLPPARDIGWKTCLFTPATNVVRIVHDMMGEIL